MAAILQISSLRLPEEYVRLDQHPEVIVRRESLERLAALDTLIFDLDGVILDPSRSIQRAHPEALKFWGERLMGWERCDGLISPADITAFKLAGGFNDDWNIAAAAGLFYCVKAEALNTRSGVEMKDQPPYLQEAAAGSEQYGGGRSGFATWLESSVASEPFAAGYRRAEDETLVQVFKEIVSGPHCPEMYGFQAQYYMGEGLISNDALLLDPRELDLPYKVGIFTGRTYGEVKIGLRITGLQDWVPDEHMLTWNDGMLKPDGRPLGILARRLASQCAAFVGDNPDDMRSVHLYRSGASIEMYSVQVCFGAQPDRSLAEFVEGGADMIAPDASSALKALQSLRERKVV